jgi:hypothetical protein
MSCSWSGMPEYRARRIPQHPASIRIAECVQAATHSSREVSGYVGVGLACVSLTADKRMFVSGSISSPRTSTDISEMQLWVQWDYAASGFTDVRTRKSTFPML